MKLNVNKKALNALSLHILFNCVDLTKHYFRNAFNLPVSKPRLLRQTKKFMISTTFTDYGKRTQQCYVAFSFIIVCLMIYDIWFQYPRYNMPPVLAKLDVEEMR